MDNQEPVSTVEADDPVVLPEPVRGEAPPIYCVDPRTGEYLPLVSGGMFADPDPMDINGWLVPAYAYLDAPPALEAQQAAVRTADGWLVVEDHRGTFYSTDTGAPILLAELGPVPSGMTDQPRPSAAHVWADGTWVMDANKQATWVAEQRQAACSRIDQAADRARSLVVGDPTRALEYQKAADEAQAFANAGYPTDAVPRPVAAWAINGRTAQQAADSILAEAAAYTEALYVIRETRLAAKEQIRTLMAAGEVEQAQQLAEQTIAAIEAAVAGVGNAAA